MAYCSKCGSSYKSGIAYCPKCGSKLPTLNSIKVPHGSSKPETERKKECGEELENTTTEERREN